MDSMAFSMNYIDSSDEMQIDYCMILVGLKLKEKAIVCHMD
jgi:hypothetical protein